MVISGRVLPGVQVIPYQDFGLPGGNPLWVGGVDEVWCSPWVIAYPLLLIQVFELPGVNAYERGYRGYLVCGGGFSLGGRLSLVRCPGFCVAWGSRLWTGGVSWSSCGVGGVHLMMLVLWKGSVLCAWLSFFVFVHRVPW